jgi:hypothetical protein
MARAFSNAVPAFAIAILHHNVGWQTIAGAMCLTG